MALFLLCSSSSKYANLSLSLVFFSLNVLLVPFSLASIIVFGLSNFFVEVFLNVLPGVLCFEVPLSEILTDELNQSFDKDPSLLFYSEIINTLLTIICFIVGYFKIWS